MWTSSLFVVICGGLMLSIEAKSLDLKNEKSTIKFDDIFPSKFIGRGFSGTWISANEFTYNSNGDLTKFNVKTGQNDVILSKDFINEHSWSGATFRISSDLKKVF